MLATTQKTNKQLKDQMHQFNSNKIPIKTRTDDWIKALLQNENSKDWKKNAANVLYLIKKELSDIKGYQRNVATCRLNLRVAVHFLDKGGYKFLEYNSFKVCLETEFTNAKSLSTLYREARAAELEVILFGEAEIGDVKESVLRPLNKLGKDEKLIKKAWNKAIKTIDDGSKFPTAKIVKNAVDDLLGAHTQEPIRWSKESASYIAESIAPKLKQMLSIYDGNLSKKRIQQVLDSIEQQLLEECDA